MLRFRTVALSSILLLGLSATFSAMAQSKFSQFLDKVDSGLKTVNSGLSVVTGQSSPAAALSVRSMNTGMAPVKPGDDNQSVMSGAVEIRFMQGSKPDQVDAFNAALPVIDKTLGILGCLRSRQAQQGEADRTMTVLRRYEVEEGISYWSNASVTPMRGVRYHDENLCLAIKKIEVTVPAPTAVSLRVTYVATDSLETVRTDYMYRRDYHGEWQLASLGNIR